MTRIEHKPWHILPVIVLAQFAGTSLWFASNAILTELVAELSFPATALGTLTSAVQLGFIAGALLFSVLTITDRVSPRLVFLLCALGGAFFNSTILWWEVGLSGYSFQRFCVGVTLAGIYPVGMKIASDWYKDGLGRALGFLVGAVVLGTAFPHFLRAMGQNLNWRGVLGFVSVLAAAGGILLFLTVKDGPNRRPSQGFEPKALFEMFKLPDFRAATFGYFGHMWELYAFWALVPVILDTYVQSMPGTNISISLWSSFIIGIGGLGCAVGGLLSQRVGSAWVAFALLAVSGLFCLGLPLLFQAPKSVFLGGLLIWGVAVVGDSPQYSALSAQTAPKDYVGSALTIMNCIGFAVTVVSIFLVTSLRHSYSVAMLSLFLVPGPIFGLLALRPFLWRSSSEPKPHTL